MKYFTLDIFLIFLLFSTSKSLVEFKDEGEPSQEFRGVWVSPWGGDDDLVPFISIEQFKKNMTYILDTLKEYKMNAIIYHVRTHNDALYESKLNPISKYFEKVNYKEFDPLKWMIDETHRRGIEFHAWMNPYRIKSENKTTIEELLEKYKNYPRNPASDKKYILVGNDIIIMDPGYEEVRQFISDTIIEFFDKYDVEAIHFDDYFYCDMGADGHTEGNYTILNEPDQKTYIEYIKNHSDCKYKNDSATDKANWRREQIDFLIQLLRENINKYNKEHKKHIQFGISPTGIYRNGDGKVEYDDEKNAITNGSKTNGQEHYASYLFCDTLKWCNKGWIDYILPQNYFSRDSPTAPFGECLDWWDKVLKFKNKVNLYQGVGLYQADLDIDMHSWQKDEQELYKDLKDVANSERSEGISIYNFHTLRTYKDGKNDKFSSKQIKNGIKAWTKRVLPTEIKAFDKINLDAPKNAKLVGDLLSFDKVDDAKFYVIYQSKEELKFNENEIIDIIGNPENKQRIEWKVKNIGNKFGVRAISYSNTLGKTTNIVNFSKMNSVFLFALGCYLILLF